MERNINIITRKWVKWIHAVCGVQKEIHGLIYKPKTKKKRMLKIYLEIRSGSHPYCSHGEDVCFITDENLLPYAIQAVHINAIVDPGTKKKRKLFLNVICSTVE